MPGRSLLVTLIAVAFISYSAHVQSEPSNQRLLLILMDGFRYDYLNQSNLPLPGFQKIIDRGVKPEACIPDFPTLSYPNYYSIMTGLHTESHGMTGNYMYDVTRNESFLIGTNPEQYNAHWWDGGDPLWVTAVRQNKNVHMWYWPGCEVEIRGIRPTFCNQYKGVPTMDDLDHALNASLSLLQAGKTDVAAVYFEQTDSEGHSYGPFSQELNQVLLNLDPLMSELADRLSKPALSNVNLMIFSDHGMTSVSDRRTINLSQVLSPEDYKSVMEYGAISSIYTMPGKEVEVYNKLRNFHPNLTVYRQSDLPDRWRYKHGKYVAPITAMADKGWFILNPARTEYPLRSKDNQTKLGWHGFDNEETDMYGTFLGMGPAFKSGVTSGPIRVVDLYQVMCDILDISAAPNNGSTARMTPLLKDSTGYAPAVTSSLTTILATFFIVVMLFETF